LLVDISGPAAGGPAQAAAAGHAVVRVVPVHPGTSGTRGTGRRPPPLGRVAPVVAESGSLAFLADGCADGVIAEDGALSRQLMAEDLAAEITRVLRPGGTVFATVDSLVLGMAILAEQHHWAHLTDLPHAEVVLIPWPDGTITRCFGAAQLYDLLTEAGLQVTSIRPRTVLSPSTVDHVLRRQPGAMARLVHAELQAGRASAPPARGRGFRHPPARPPPQAAPRPVTGSVPTVPLGLAPHATGGFWPGVQPPLRNRLATVGAVPVVPAVDPHQSIHDQPPLRLDGSQHRLGPVRLGQRGSRVRRVLRRVHLRASRRVLSLQHQDGLLDLAAHLLKALACGDSVHRCPPH